MEPLPFIPTSNEQVLAWFRGEEVKPTSHYKPEPHVHTPLKVNKDGTLKDDS